jgi:hypothetical protein
MSNTPNAKKKFEEHMKQVSKNLELLNKTPSPVSKLPLSPSLTRVRKEAYKSPLFSPKKLFH